MKARKFEQFDEFQKECSKTAIYPKVGKNFVYPALGLVGEAGEVANKVKKVIRDNGGKLNDEIIHELAKELGDVLWYAAQLSTELKIKFSDVVDMMFAKLSSRSTRKTLHGSGDNR